MSPALALLLPATLTPSVAVGPDGRLRLWTPELVWQVEGERLLSVHQWHKGGEPYQLSAGETVWEIDDEGVSRAGRRVFSGKVEHAEARGKKLWVLSEDRLIELPFGARMKVPEASRFALLPHGVALIDGDSVEVRNGLGGRRCSLPFDVSKWGTGIAAAGRWIAANAGEGLVLIDASTCAVRAAVPANWGQPGFAGDTLYVVGDDGWSSFSLPDLHPLSRRLRGLEPFDLRVGSESAEVVPADPAVKDEQSAVVSTPHGVVRLVTGPGGPGPRLRVHPQGVVAWDPDTGRDLGVPFQATPHLADVSPDGRLAITLAYGQLEAWETARGIRLWRSPAPASTMDDMIRIEGGAVVWRSRREVGAWRATDGELLWILGEARLDGVGFVEVRSAAGTWRPWGPPGSLDVAPPFPAALPELPEPAPGLPGDDAIARLDLPLPAPAVDRSPWPREANVPLALAPPQPFPNPPADPRQLTVLLHGNLEHLGALRGPQPEGLAFRLVVPVELAGRSHIELVQAERALGDRNAKVALEEAGGTTLAEGQGTLLAADGTRLAEGTPAELRRAFARVGLDLLETPLPRDSLPARWRYLPPEPALGLAALEGGGVALRTASTLAVLDADGRLVWSAPATLRSLFATAGVALGDSKRELLAFDTHTGAQRWSRNETLIFGAAEGLAWVEAASTREVIDVATGEVRWQAAGSGMFRSDARVVGGTVHTEAAGFSCRRKLGDGRFLGCARTASLPVPSAMEAAEEEAKVGGWAPVRLGSAGGDWAVLNGKGQLELWLGPGEAPAAMGRDLFLIVDGGIQAWRVP